MFLRKIAPSIKCTQMRPCLVTVNNIPCKHCRRGRTFHELSPCKERKVVKIMVLSGTLEKCLLLVREKGRVGKAKREKERGEKEERDEKKKKEEWKSEGRVREEWGVFLLVQFFLLAANSQYSTPRS